MRAGALLSILLVGLVTVATVSGLLAPSIYRDEPLIAGGWVVNDAVTLLVAVPILLAARHRAVQHSLGGRLVWIGTLHYMLYNYAFYLFGAALNALLLLYAAIISIAGWSLVLVIADTSRSSIEAGFRDPPARRVASWMLFVSLGLSVTWTAQWLVALLRTTAPGRFDLTPEFIRVVAGLDLTMMVGLLVPGALMLWRRRPWGLMAGTSLNVSGALYNVVLAAGTVNQIRAGLAGGWPLLVLWIALCAGCLVAAERMLASARRSSG